MSEQKTIVLAVTAARSLALLDGFPEYLSERGWNVHVVASPGERLTELGARPGIVVHEAPMARRPQPVADLRALAHWVRLLRSIRPDVVSSGTPKAGLLGMVAARLTGVRTRVYVLRGLRLESVRNRVSRAILWTLELITVRCATSVLAVSPSLLDKVVELRLASPTKVTVLGAGSSNGVHTQRFRAAAEDRVKVETLRSSLGLEADVPVVGFVGRLTRDKGLETLASARRTLVDLDIDHQVLLIGTVDGGLDRELVNEVVSVGRPAVVTGHVPDTSPYYPLMDVLCLPTRREGFPNVVLEAAAAGVPTVTTSATGAIDSVVDGVTGFVAPTGEFDAYAQSLARILCMSAGERRTMGHAARERAHRSFARETVQAGHAHYYATLAAQHSEGSPCPQ